MKSLVAVRVGVCQLKADSQNLEFGDSTLSRTSQGPKAQRTENINLYFNVEKY